MERTANAAARAAIALGSNVGARAAHLDAAVLALGRVGRVVAVSRYIETEPVGYLAQGKFLNAAAVVETALGPEALMGELLRIERENGRERVGAVPKGPRTLDLDLLLYERGGASPEEHTAGAKARIHGGDGMSGLKPGPTINANAPNPTARESLVMETADLVLPHPEMHRRRFVLEPLAEVAGDWVHPVLTKTVKEILEKQ